MIIITTMDKLPDYCYDCPCHNGETGLCKADENGRYTSEYRPFWCPLKETTVKMTVCKKCGLEHPAYNSKCPKCGSEKIYDN